MKKQFRKLLAQEDLNFLLTNRVPRIALTHFMGKFSKIRNPIVSKASIGMWRLFTDLDLSDARTRKFRSMHDCFTRELMPGARPVDPDPGVLTSPCDAIVGACGAVSGTTVFQAKGFPYRMEDLFGPGTDTAPFRDGRFITLRLTSAMYHRFHAPHDCDVSHVSYISGDTWNVNPIALKRVERLFCRNERAVLSARLRRGNFPVAIVPVAAILVASIRLKFTDVLLHLKYRGPNEIPVAARFAKGEEMGGFQHGSTIILFVPPGFEFADGIATGARIRMGQPLMRLPPQAQAHDEAEAACALEQAARDAATGLAQNAAMNLRASAFKSIACGLLAVLCAGVGAADTIGPGDLPPPVIGWTAGGDLVRVPDYAGKAVILTFWASWCGYCLKELPVLDNVQRVAGADNIAVFAVNTEDRKVFRQIEPLLRDKLHLVLVRDADGAGQRNYGVTGLPHMVIIGRDGRVRRVWHGYSPDELEAIVADINAALAVPKSPAP